jgi:hypothetical protein
MSADCVVDASVGIKLFLSEDLSEEKVLRIRSQKVSDTVVEVHLPTPLLQLGLDREEVQRRVTEWLVLSLFTEDRISSGKAARLLNKSRREI